MKQTPTVNHHFHGLSCILHEELLSGLHTREEDLRAGAGCNWNRGSPDCSPAAEAWARQDWGTFAVHCPCYQNKIIVYL